MSTSFYFYCFAIIPLVILVKHFAEAKSATWNQSIAIGSFNEADSENGPYTHFVELNYSVKSAKVSDWKIKEYTFSERETFLPPGNFKTVQDVTFTVKSVPANWLKNKEDVSLPKKIVAKGGVFQAIIGIEEIPKTRPESFRQFDLCDDENEECVTIKINCEDIGNVLEKNIYLHLTKLPKLEDVGSLVPEPKPLKKESRKSLSLNCFSSRKEKKDNSKATSILLPNGAEVASYAGMGSVTIEIFGNVWINEDSARRLGYVPPKDGLVLPLFDDYSPFKEKFEYKLKAYLHEYTIDTPPTIEGRLNLLVRRNIGKYVSIDATNGRFNFSVQTPKAVENQVHGVQQGPYVYFYLVPRDSEQKLIELGLSRFTCPKPSVVAKQTRFRHDIKLTPSVLHNISEAKRNV